ncbi:uncharacterized protein NPIL_585601 [Nephila pilipes]|uniref:Gustatory receptor n=1 Tax=Nephila pilipes TaxID=299642 RepID=A0A8X6MEX6_NEPPI|nr:uncharacterized protein NPIL_585601 [Nephila pilipes]
MQFNTEYYDSPIFKVSSIPFNMIKCLEIKLGDEDLKNEVSSIPKYLFKSICWIGLVEQSDKCLLYRTTTALFQFAIVFISLSMWISSFIAFDTQNFKITIAYVIGYSFALGVYFSMRHKRKILTTTLRKLNQFPGPSGEKINFAILLLCCIPFVYSILKPVVYNDARAIRFEAYGYYVENRVAQIVLISIKSFFYALVQPTSTTLIALLYCTLCQRCCVLLNHISQVIQLTSPDAFSYSRQMDVLKCKIKIDEILDSIQNVFSLPSFFMIVANFFTTGTVIGWFLFLDSSIYQLNEIAESVYHITTDFGCMIVVLWVAGGIPVQLEKLKDTFYKTLSLRYIFRCSVEEPQLKKELFGKINFVLTGCDVISFKKSTILTVCGTLLTYTVLIVSTKS